ncbi:hypothetical protein GCM10012283_27770 [Phycicoccus endophyticus]|nr:hypothetical protein GCM10012283_27770 [Phycicoccus endophyticus]
MDIRNDRGGHRNDEEVDGSTVSGSVASARWLQSLPQLVCVDRVGVEGVLAHQRSDPTQGVIRELDLGSPVLHGTVDARLAGRTEVAAVLPDLSSGAHEFRPAT